MKRFSLFFPVFLIAVILFPGFAFAQTESNFVITNFNSDLNIQSNGSVLVTETIAVDFGQNYHHGIYRYIPYVYKNESGGSVYTEITNVKTLMDGNSVPDKQTSDNSYITLQIGDANKTIIGQHIYTISYLAWGVLKSFDQYDELYWNVTGNSWTVPIEKSSAKVSLPSGNVIQSSCYFGPYGSAIPCFSKENSTSTVVFEQNTILNRGSGLTVAVGFTKGVVPVITSDQINQNRTAKMPIMWSAFAIVLVIGLFFVFEKWKKKGRDFWYGDKGVVDMQGEGELKPIGAKDTIIVQYDPPKNIRVGEAGVIKDETADTLDISATIVDLAVRGYIHITEIPKKGIFGKTDYRMDKIKNPDDSLLEYETFVLCSIFEIKNDKITKFVSSEKSSVLISELKTEFGKYLRSIKFSLYTDVANRKYFTESPTSTRSGYILVSVLFIVLGLSSFLASFGQFISPVTDISTLVSILRGVGLALLSIAITLIIVGIKAMPQRTALGHQLYREIKGYEIFINNVEKYRQQFFEKQNVFMDILPYAMIFKATKKLASAMKDMDIQTTQPNWFTGSVAVFSISSFADSMESFSHSLNAAVAPSGSGSGGGGFSGGGFGGGGGGGW